VYEQLILARDKVMDRLFLEIRQKVPSEELEPQSRHLLETAAIEWLRRQGRFRLTAPSLST
jgi:hypothetical protein